MKRLSHLIFCLFLSCLLAACATLPAKQGALNHHIPWPERKKQLSAIQHWQIEGAVAIKTPQHGQTASLNWQQQNHTDYQMSLFGPLGVGRVSLTGNTDGVTLLANNHQYQAKTPEALMQKMLGWHLPVRNLYYWIRGLAAPGFKAQLTFDTYQHLAKLEQQGWWVTYQRYTGVGRYDLPSLLQLQHGNLTVKIVISQWQL